MLALLPGIAFADKVVIDNGDSLTGTVVKLAEGKLTLSTEYAGPVAINAANVSIIETDRPVEVHTANGEILKGKLKMTDPGKLLIEQSPDREAAVINWNNVSMINPPARGAWKGNVNAGGNLQSGNTDRSDLSLGGAAERRAERDRFSLGFLFNYVEEDKKLAGRNAFANAKYDYFLTKKLYWYLGLELLSDKFQDIALRTTLGPGIGYQVWDDPVKSLAMEAGVSYFSENLREGRDSEHVGPRLGLNFRHKLFKFVIFSDSLLFYTKVEDPGDYTLRNEAALVTQLGAQWALRLAEIVQYNNKPSEGVGKTDSQLILGIQYSF